MSGYPRPEPTSRALPAWSSVLAVVAHPDDESFGLGAILDAFNQAGTRTAVLCLTHGEASTVYGVAGNLAELRGEEFAAAAQILGVLTSRCAITPTVVSTRYLAAAWSAK